MLRVELQKLISVSQVGGLALSVTFGDSSPKGRAKGVTGTFLASPFGRGGTPLGVTERARPLPMLAGLCRTPHEGCKTCILFAATMLY